jgi:hypothetical protein
MYGDDPAYLRFRHLILNILDLQVGSESLAIVPGGESFQRHRAHLLCGSHPGQK